MVLVGNMLCIAACVVETFLMNSLWLGWGQITAIFKEEGLFSSYCDRNATGHVYSCDRRDVLLNNVYTLRRRFLLALLCIYS